MPYCNNCGQKVAEKDTHCPNCGSPLANIKDAPIRSPPGKQPGQFSHQYSYGYIPIAIEADVAQRTFIKYIGLFIIGVILTIVPVFLAVFGEWDDSLIFFTLFGTFVILVGSIFLYVYLYHNFNDYKMHMYKYHPGEYPQPQDPLLMVILYIIFSPVTIYFKYNQLYEHLKNRHQQNRDLPPSIWYYFGGLIVYILVLTTLLVISFTTWNPVFFYLLGLSSVFIGVFIFYLEYRWQVAFNAHIQAHKTGVYYQ